jgi:dTDP-4-dehydrorhamnose reductase
MNSPVKIQILDFLKISSVLLMKLLSTQEKLNLQFQYISTTYVSSGLVEEEYDPDDKRRKTYHSQM